MSLYLTNKPSVKKYFLFLPFLLLLITGARAQEGLLVKNNRNGKAWMYEKNARVTYICFGEQEYKTAILNTLLDSSVVFGKDTVLLKNIAGVRKKNPIHNLSRVIGMPLMFIGSLFMGQGAASMYSDPASPGGIRALLLGAGIFSLGYIPYELSLEDLRVGFQGEWTIEIYRGTR